MDDSWPLKHWDTAQYLGFCAERLRPALDLIAHIPSRGYKTIHDLGCGPGNVTRILAERWPGARVTGVDYSREMLSEARRTDAAIEWIEADIGRWHPHTPPDLVYSNAALHWLDRHDDLFPRLIGHLAPGGCLAVQMPLSWDQPSHRLMRETLVDGGPGGTPLGDNDLRLRMMRQRVEEPGAYYDLLSARTAGLDIWETEYLHVLEGESPVLEWVKGTGLRPILESLGDEERECFLDEYARRLRAAYPRRADGRTLYPFRRLFMVATI